MGTEGGRGCVWVRGDVILGLGVRRRSELDAWECGYRGTEETLLSLGHAEVERRGSYTMVRSEGS